MNKEELFDGVISNINEFIRRYKSGSYELKHIEENTENLILMLEAYLEKFKERN